MDIKNNEDKELLNQLILSILDNVNIRQVGWEGREDVMTVNDKPIGGTISNKSLEIDRWMGTTGSRKKTKTGNS